MGAACCRRSRPVAAQDGGDSLQDDYDGDRLVGPAPKSSKLDAKGYKLVVSPTGVVRRQLRTPSVDLPALPAIE